MSIIAMWFEWHSQLKVAIKPLSNAATLALFNALSRIISRMRIFIIYTYSINKYSQFSGS